MNDQEVSGGGSATAGDAHDRAVTAEWRRTQRDRFDAERTQAKRAQQPRRRIAWAGLLASLAAGVVAAILANIVVGTPGRPGGDETPGSRAPLGLLARPETSPEPPLSADELASAPGDPTAGDAPAGDVEVFVPVPKTVVGPPARAEGAGP